MTEIKEECGVFGVTSPFTYDAATTVYYGLYSLQHRGQESCGIVVNDDGVFCSHKDLGQVNEVFQPQTLSELGQGQIAIGHVRYATTGSADRANAQPIVVNHIKGSMAVAHNGNLTNSFELRRELELNGSIFHSTSDTEVIAYCITRARLHCDSIEHAIAEAMKKFEGAYSLVIMSPAKMIAVRDPYGLRPLCYGITEDGRYAVASESCALDAVSARFVRDVKPGEIIVFEPGKEPVSIEDNCSQSKQHTCIFEYIYFARPDSVIDGIDVHRARVNAGRILDRTYPVDADIVIGVPDSGLDAAIGYADESGIPYGIGFVKNKYIGRTFIEPGQAHRESLVDIKLNVIASVVTGKRVVLIDDSVVRGTTSKRIVKKLRDAGAREVHLRLASPTFVAPCYYGTDIPDTSTLIAANNSLDEVKEYIGCDSIGFYRTEDLPGMLDGRKTFCQACFTGEYPAGSPRVTGKYRFESKRGSEMKEYTPVKEGKVRELYEAEGNMIMVATDRISAFDVILKNRIEGKGIVLTQMAKFWFDLTKDIVPNHVISTDVNDMPEFFRKPEFEGRTTLCRKLEMLPLECIVRGYISGSCWNAYKESGTVCGIRLPEGLKESQKLDSPIYTPSTKAEIGDHDISISYEESIEVLEKRYPGKGSELARKVRDLTIAIYNKCEDYALSRGIIIADTKLEFGLDENGELVLADEVLTPDSSRFWPLDGYEEGKPQPSYDKQFVRDWLKANPDSDYNLPQDVIDKTIAKYKEAYHLITGKTI